MPEGHTVHRLARLVARDFSGRRVVVDSPQGRFARGARELDGCCCTGTDAHGKHLLVAFADDAGAGAAAGEPDRWLHVHLGLYGKWAFGEGELPAVRGAVRMRLAAAPDGQPLPDLSGAAGAGAGRPDDADDADDGDDGPDAAAGEAPGEADTGRDADVLAAEPRTAADDGGDGADDADDAGGPAHGRADDGLERGGGAEVGQLDPARTHWAELRGPTRCEVLDARGVAALHARLGPDPLRADGDAADFTARVNASRTTVAALLMRQDVIAGVGNIYRAEALFRARLSPATPGRDVPGAVLAGIWDDLVVLMRAGVRAGRIVTTRPADRGGQRGRAGAFYVYGRAGEPCRVCGTDVETQVLAGRNLFWCPVCQRPEQAPRA